jgi:hypothetical protein
VELRLTHIVRVMGQAFFICQDTRKLSRFTNIISFNPGAETILCRREGEKFHKPKVSYLHALCQGFGLG